MVCYACPKNVSSGNVAFVIDSSGTSFEYYDSEGKYLGNNKPKFDDALLGVKNGLWFTAGVDGDLAHENLKKQGIYSCD